MNSLRAVLISFPAALKQKVRSPLQPAFDDEESCENSQNYACMKSSYLPVPSDRKMSNDKCVLSQSKREIIWPSQKHLEYLGSDDVVRLTSEVS